MSWSSSARGERRPSNPGGARTARRLLRLVPSGAARALVGAVVGASLLSGAAAAQVPADLAARSDAVLLRTRQFVPQPNVTRDAMARLQRPVSGVMRVLLQFDRPIGTTEVAALARQGLRVHHFIPNNAVSVTVPTTFDPATLPGVRWIGQLAASDKLSPHTRAALDRARQQQAFVYSVVEFFGDVTGAQATQAALAAGAEPMPHPSLPPHVLVVRSLDDAVERLAGRDEVAWIYPAAGALVTGAPLLYCPGSLTEVGPVANFAVIGSGWDGPGLGSASLTYHFGTGTPDLAGDVEFDEVEKGIREWAKHVDLTFAETGSANQSQSFDNFWGPTDHGDGFPFGSNTLAHAFFPAPNPNPETIAGDMHFNENFSWGIGTLNPTDVFTVAMHEAGHALGLLHSSDSGAVMFPVIQQVHSGLAQDDIDGILTLYAPATTTPNPMMTLDLPLDGSAQTQPFLLGGWALDLAATAGSGVDTVHVWAFPASGSGAQFIGAANYGAARPDVGAAFGSQFTNSSFDVMVSGLPAGTYDLVAFAYSSVAGTFNNAQTVTVTVSANPQMSVDLPAASALVTQPFIIAGWAIDLAAATHSGVNTVHVWAFPVAGGAPIFAGVASYGGARPDVGAAFGAQFTNSGFGLAISSLPPGVYDVVAYPFSTVAGTFNNWQVVRVTVG